MSKTTFELKQEWLESVMASDLTPAQKVFAWGVWSAMYGDKTTSYPGSKHLEELTGLNRSKFKGHRDALVSIGAMTATLARSASGDYDNYTYELHLGWRCTPQGTTSLPEGTTSLPEGTTRTTQRELPVPHREVGVPPRGNTNTSIKDINKSINTKTTDDGVLLEGQGGVVTSPNKELTNDEEKEPTAMLPNWEQEDAGMRTTGISDAQAFNEGEQCFNYFESRLTKKTGRPLTNLWAGYRLAWLGVMKALTKDRAKHLIDVWIESDPRDVSQAAFLKQWTRVQDTALMLTEDSRLRHKLAGVSESRAEAWRARKASLPVAKEEPQTIPLTDEEARRAFAEIADEVQAASKVSTRGANGNE